jgi:DNA (cytosine-5)-methyltransferase 3A
LFLQKEYEIIKKQLSNRKSNLEFLGGIMSKDRWLKGADYSRNFSQGNRVYGVSKKSVCLTANGGGLGAKTGLYYIGKNIDNISCKEIRRLSPLECERLQTVPDNYTDCVSNTQRYRMLGNGWTIDVIVHILNGLVEKNNKI